jgi:hypothetical protein
MCPPGDGSLLNYRLTRDGCTPTTVMYKVTVRGQNRRYRCDRAFCDMGNNTENVSQLWNTNESAKFFSNRPRIPPVLDW